MSKLFFSCLHVFKINHFTDKNFTWANWILFINYSFSIHSTLFICCSTRSKPMKTCILIYTNTVSIISSIDVIKKTTFFSINTLRIKITPISISSAEIKCDRLKTISNAPTKKEILPNINLNFLFIILIFRRCFKII